MAQGGERRRVASWEGQLRRTATKAAAWTQSGVLMNQLRVIEIL